MIDEWDPFCEIVYRAPKVRKSPVVLSVPRSDADGLAMVKRIYYGMLDRCHNPSCAGFPYYGAKGVAVCDSWRQSWQNFYSDVGLPPPLMGAPSIDRINSVLGYFPENVRWLDRGENSRRSNRPK